VEKVAFVADLSIRPMALGHSVEIELILALGITDFFNFFAVH
jgi:hypothetical protein